MRMYDIIDNKKHGKELSFDEIKFFVDGFTDGSVLSSFGAAYGHMP